MPYGLNRCVVTTASLEMPLDRKRSQPWRVDCCSTRPLTLSGRFLWFVPTDSNQPSCGSVMFRHQSDSVMFRHQSESPLL